MKNSENSGKKVIIVVLLAVLIVLALFNLFFMGGFFEKCSSGGGGRTSATDELPPTISDDVNLGFTVDDIPEPPEPPEPVVVTTPSYRFSYSGERDAAITVREIDGSGGNDLEFTVQLSSGETTLFSIHYNSTEGSPVIEIADNNGGAVPFAFRMGTLPEGANAEDQYLFYSAQEVINEVVPSLRLN